MFLFKKVLTKNYALGAAVVAAVLLAPGIASAATAYVSASVNVRSGPGVNYGKLTALPAGARINAGACRNGWCQVYNGNNVGWVSARYIRFGAYRGSAYPVPVGGDVIVDNGWASGFGLGLGLGWASGDYRGHGHWRHNHWRHGWHGGHRHWNPRWGHGPRRKGGGKWAGRGWPSRHIRPNWGPGPVIAPGHSHRNRSHFGNVRPMHAGR